MSNLDALLKEAFEALNSGKIHVAAVHYKAILDLVSENHKQENDVDKNIIKYLLSLIALESNQLEEINDAFQTLTVLEKSMGNKFPAIYYALGKAHLKLFRFELANAAIKKGFSSLHSEGRLKAYYIPGTNTVLSETKKEGLSMVLMHLKDECSGWHRPDAICNSPNCQNYTEAHTVSNRNIFYSDPAFIGMVRVTCNNCMNPCIVNFHQICWKTTKERLSPIQKLSDKDVIGYKCFTPNCDNETTFSIIIKIEVLGENAEVKTVIEMPTGSTQSAKPLVAKGAIRKQSVQSKEKKRFEKSKKQPLPVVIQQPKEAAYTSKYAFEWGIMKLVELRSNNFYVPTECDWRPDKEMYGNSNLMEIDTALLDPDFRSSEEEIDSLQNFTFSMLYGYILNNAPVKVNDVLDQWEETMKMFPTSSTVVNCDIEIIDFILQSLKVVLVGDYICTPKILPYVYNLVKKNTSECFRFAIQNTLDQEEIDMEDDFVYGQIMQDEGGRCTPKEVLPEFFSEQQLEKKYMFVVEDFEGSRSSEPKKNNKTKIQISEGHRVETMFRLVRGMYEQAESYHEMGYNEIDYIHIENNETGDDALKTGPGTDGSLTYNNHGTSYNSRCRSNSSHDYFSTTKENDMENDMENDEYQKYSDHIAQLKEEIQCLTTEKMLAGQKISQLLQEKGQIIKSFETELAQQQQKLEAYNSLMNATKNAQISYESLTEDFNEFKEDYASVLNAKKALERKLEDYSIEKKAIAKDFENQYSSKCAEKDKITQELKDKIKKLENEQNSMLELKQSLLQKCLQIQFIANKNLLNGYVEQCKTTIEVFTSANAFLKNTLNMNLFPEIYKWSKILIDLKGIESENQMQFSKLYKMLQSKEEVGDIEDISLKLREIPTLPLVSLGESVQRALSVIYTHFMKMIPYVSSMPPPQPLMHARLGPAMYMQPPQQYMVNPGYQFQRNRLPYPPPISVQPPQHMSYDFPPPELPPIQNSNDQPNITNTTQNTMLADSNNTEWKNTKAADGTKDSKEVSLEQEILIEEKENLSEVSSIGESSTSLSMKLETQSTPRLNGLPPKKIKYGIDRVMEKLRQEFMGIPELDLIECVWDIRKMHNNSLNGLSTSDIIKEAKEFLFKRQHKHIYDYNIVNIQVEPKEQKYEYNEAPRKEKPVLDGKDNFHPFDFERLSVKRNRQNSDSSTMSGGCVSKVEFQPVEKLPLKQAWVFKSSENNWNKKILEVECNICMEPLENTGCKKTVYTLRCQHSFHTECIRSWFKCSQSCPSCRVFSTLDDDFPPLPS